MRIINLSVSLVLNHLPIWIRSAISSDMRWSKKDKEIWNHHNCWYIFGLIEALQEKYYKDTEITDMREYVLSGQMIQAEAI